MLKRLRLLSQLLHLQLEFSETGQSINQVLQAAFQILNYERVRRVSRLTQRALISYSGRTT